MTNEPTTIGIVTARGGSKAIPRKNIVDFQGKPLITYTFDAAKQSKLLTRCIVSTDDPDIAAIAKARGGEVPFMRPGNLAQDGTPTIEVLQHALQWIQENEGKQYDYVMVLQPTSPLRTTEDIDAAIQIMIDTKADSVMSMVELPDFAPQKIKIIDHGVLKPFIATEGRQSEQRSDGTKAYKRNCAIYLTRRELIEKGDLFGERSMAYVMPRERSVDINEPVDLELAAFFLQRMTK